MSKFLITYDSPSNILLAIKYFFLTDTQTNKREQIAQKQTHQLWPPDSDKEVRSIHWRKRKASLPDSAGDTEYPPVDQSTLIPFPHPFQKQM